MTARRMLLVLVCALATLFAGASAWAKPLTLAPASGVAPLELVQHEGRFRGKLVLKNTGSEAVPMPRVSLRDGTDTDPRLPAGLKLAVSGSDLAALRPGEQREITVEWSVPRGRRWHGVWGQVLVDVEGQERPLAAGFVAKHGVLTGPFGSRVLSWLLLIPALAALGLGLLRARLPRPGTARQVVLGVALAQLALVAWAAARFDLAFTRFQGGDGLQLVERWVLARGAGVEWFLAIDGLSLGLLLLLPVLIVIAALGTPPSATRPGSFWALVCLLDAALVGVFTAFDLALWLGFWLLALVAVVLLLAGFCADGLRVAIRLGGQLVLGTLALAAAIWVLSGTEGATYLVDGMHPSRTFALTELGHGGFVPGAAAVFGVAPVKLAFALLLLGSALLLAVPPFHGWLGAALARVPTPLGVLLVGGVCTVGGYALLRIGYGALPDAMAWAATTVGVLGLAGALWAALGALGADDLRRFAGYVASAHSGLVLVAAASLTAIGVQGALLGLVARALSVAMLLFVVGALRERLGTSDARRLGGVAGELPVLGAFGALAIFAGFAAPASGAFLGAVTTLTGTFPTQRWLALLVAPVLVVLIAAGAKLLRRVFTGELPAGLRQSRLLAAHGGKLPLLEERELVALLGLALVLLLLGLWPRPLLRLVDSAALDQAAYANPPGALEIL